MSITISDSVVGFMQYLLQSNASTITLISCSTRDAFIEELCQSSTQEKPGSPKPEASQAQDASEESIADVEGETYTDDHHWLFSNTIDLISRSQRVNLVFCPTVEHLRAYLGGVFKLRKKRDEHEVEGCLYQGAPVLAIVNMVSIHSPTSEFSAQGLSRTSALAVEAAARAGVELILCECKSMHDGDEIERGSRVWDAQVPLLNSMVRSMGEERSPNVRTIQVKQILKKWFRFDNTNGEEM
ncbi:uncharacterized protein GIQ15_02447 [Arthroderma uncinatum]|uniref:uncharacterized protein n=1 Tax=Arthroderma uncinatum TaxID=74035 RepID=UPI00144AC599|nr:uncharacterized protein GIQ15_02447 [Arthroderma uncinatum]KAF3483123.1 hypothetical protein GIQ15_02447 [Arthroderma uncinatum]